jgi:hypothetical protein
MYIVRIRPGKPGLSPVLANLNSYTIEKGTYEVPTR